MQIRILVTLLFFSIAITYFFTSQTSSEHIQSTTNNHINNKELTISTHENNSANFIPKNQTPNFSDSRSNQKIPKDTKDKKINQSENPDDIADKNAIAKRKSEEFTQYSKELNEKGLSIQEDLYEKFQREAIDSEWAPAYEEKIRNFVSENSELNYFVPDSVICKTNRCQIKLHTANSEELSHVSTLFATTLHTAHSEIYKSEVVAVPDFTQKTVIFYIGKSDEEKIYQ